MDSPTAPASTSSPSSFWSGLARLAKYDARYERLARLNPTNVMGRHNLNDVLVMRLGSSNSTSNSTGEPKLETIYSHDRNQNVNELSELMKCISTGSSTGRNIVTVRSRDVDHGPTNLSVIASI